MVKVTLHKITDHITQEYAKNKNPEVIEWFNKCFKELPNISETRIFLKEICKSILTGGTINELESKFILNCIRNYHFTFTVSVNKEHREIEGEIIFEDRSYEIFKNDNKQSNISIEEFAKILLAETDDPLAEQYKTHNPLFSNKGLGLKIAANDIKDVRSIINEKVISTEAYLLSFVSDIGDKFIILLEKRNIFGDHLIYKINKDNFEKVATIYPSEIDKETIKQIFKELEFEKLIQCFVKNKIFNSEEENQIFEYSGKLRKNFLQNIKKIIQDVEPTNLKLPYIDVNIRLDAHENILKDSGTTQKANINREIEKLKQENPSLYNYCNAFYWNIKNIINACCIAETEFFKNNTDKEKTIRDRIILFATKPLIKSLNSAMSNLPFVAAIADFIADMLEGAVCDWLEERHKRKCENKIISINDIIHHKIGMQDLDDSLKKIAITITHARKNEIINPIETRLSSSYIQKFQTLLQKTGNIIYVKMKEIALPKILERHDKDNIAVQLALRDSISFVKYLYTNQ